MWFRVTAVVIAVVYSIFFTLRAYDERVPVVFSRYDPLAAPLVLVALAAQKTGRPVRVQLDRDLDMALTGKRHPFHARYRVGYDDAGRARMQRAA